MTVYAILRQSNHDYKPAEKYGQLEFIFPLGINITDVGAISEIARNFFADFDFENDYFLPVGNPIVVAAVSMCLLEEMKLCRERSANFLEWDKPSQTYVTHKFDLTEEINF